MPAEVSRINKKKKDKKVIHLDKKINEKLDPFKDCVPEDIIFSLDIGTRTIVGIVGIQEKDKFKVVCAEVVEHKNRAMLDGQIHDINQVAEVAREVKEKLEKKVGVSLNRVAIAAAGRVLKTCEVRVEKDIDPTKEIDQEMMSSIEIEGIQLAQFQLDDEITKDEKTQFYCVGYSVINYYLNNYVISTLIGHKAKKIGADILATFLPHVVVDSLYTVMSKIGLEVTSLTLEPIAAINVTIPKDLRLLNLVLVDIGAGTSDIAITKDGSVIAYAMVPMAGDEITEKIAQHYLVDFNSSEKVKIALSTAKDKVGFVDILGKKHEVKVEEILEVIKPATEILAETISQKILEYNHKAPNAVFLIGGGSQVPGLTDMLAANLKLAKDRVVVRGREIIQNIKFSGKKLSGPEAITPIGIAVTAQMQKGQDFLSVTINGKKIRLFNSKKLTVADALILIGFNPSQLIGRTGKSVTFELNGVKKIIRGEYSKAAEIFVNQETANLETVLKIGDNIKVIPAEDGKSAEVNVSDYVINKKSGKITFNNSVFDIDTKIYINGKIGTSNDKIADGDIVQINETKTIGDLLRLFEIDPENYEVFIKGEKVDTSYVISEHQEIECKKKYTEPEIVESFEEEELEPEEQVFSEPLNQPIDQRIKPMEEQLENNTLRVIVNGKTTLIKGLKSQYIFVDIFNFVDFDLSKPQGNIVLRLNGTEASFTDPIKTGDVIDIYWSKSLS